MFGHSPRAFGASAFNDTKITRICDRLVPDASLGLSTPTLVSRIDGVDAVVFATRTRYTACIVVSATGVFGNQPTRYLHSSRAVNLLESFATLNKIPGGALYTTDVWFVVKLGPGVTKLKAITRGASDVSAIRGGFAFIHEKETAAVKGKFVYGVAAGFSSSGELLGSASLS
jgi:hypothetical protein